MWTITGNYADFSKMRPTVTINHHPYAQQNPNRHVTQLIRVVKCVGSYASMRKKKRNVSPSVCIGTRLQPTDRMFAQSMANALLDVSYRSRRDMTRFQCDMGCMTVYFAVMVSVLFALFFTSITAWAASTATPPITNDSNVTSGKAVCLKSKRRSEHCIDKCFAKCDSCLTKCDSKPDKNQYECEIDCMIARLLCKRGCTTQQAQHK